MKLEPHHYQLLESYNSLFVKKTLDIIEIEFIINGYPNLVLDKEILVDHPNLEEKKFKVIEIRRNFNLGVTEVKAIFRRKPKPSYS